MYPWKEPEYFIEDTVENRQKGIVELAKAYYNKGPLVQYGLQYLTHLREFDGGNLRGWTLEANTPEAATKDNTVYQWCSSFPFDVLYGGFGYRMLDEYFRCRTVYLSQGRSNDPEIVVFQFDLTVDKEKNRRVLTEAINSLQPGDLVTHTRPDRQGHTMIFVGDITGDGVGDILHCAGKRYDMVTGVDNVETIAIRLKENAQAGWLEDESAKSSLLNKVRVSIIRPALLDPQKYPMKNSLKARLTYPGLRIDRTVSVGFWGSVVSGGELTYTIELTNCSAQDHKAVPVMDAVAEHCKLLTVDGKPTQQDYPTWDVDIPAGETVTLTYTVSVTGKPGERIVSEGGSVAGIPSNRLVTTVQAFTPDGEKFRDPALQQKAAEESRNAVEFVNALYKAATGREAGVTWAKKHLNAGFDTKVAPENEERGPLTYYWPKEVPDNAARAFVPHYYGGRDVATPTNDRVLETRLADLQAGDVCLVAPKLDEGTSATYAWIHDGETFVTWVDGEVRRLDQAALTKVLIYSFFCVLRPGLTGE